MIEAILIWGLFQNLTRLAEAKGRSKRWGALGAAAWVLGEVTAFLVGSTLGLGNGAYLLGLLGAAASAYGVYAYVSRLPSLADKPIDIEKITETFR